MQKFDPGDYTLGELHEPPSHAKPSDRLVRLSQNLHYWMCFEENNKAVIVTPERHFMLRDFFLNLKNGCGGPVVSTHCTAFISTSLLCKQFFEPTPLGRDYLVKWAKWTKTSYFDPPNVLCRTVATLKNDFQNH